MNNKLKLLFFLFLILTGCVPQQTGVQGIRIIGMQTTSVEEFERAYVGREFSFPEDHGPHDEFQTEWWYYTGNLQSNDGRRFGYQLTFFRRGLQVQKDATKRESDWGTSQVYMAHFAISDISNGGFHYFERLERGAAGLAGAQSTPGYRVWVLDWFVEQKGDDRYILSATSSGVEIHLEMVDMKGAILQGDNGYSQKGAQGGNASFYYSQTRLVSSGVILINGEKYIVEGASWMDHEFSTSILEEDQIGWDWFALQLDDKSELMVFTLRNVDGEIDEYSQGMLIFPDGTQRSLRREDFVIEETQTWKSPHSSAIYPSGWKISIPSEDMSLEVEPLLSDQELNVSFTYWEGAVLVQGNRGELRIQGYGYIELTGYAHSMHGRL